MDKKIDLSLVLACYNEQEIFDSSVKKIIDTLNRSGYGWEIIFVEDKSQDKTRELIKKALKKYARFNLSAYFHDQNRGRGKSVTDGFLRATGRYVGYIDIDLETSDTYIPKFLKVLDNGADLVSASREYPFEWRSLSRWLASKGYSALRKLFLGLPYADTEGGYKFFRREKLLPLLESVRHEGWFFDTEIMALAHAAKLKVVEIPVVFIRNHHKTSTVRLIPDSYTYLVDLIKFSVWFRLPNAIKEVGVDRIAKYFIYELWYGIFVLLPFSPLRVFWLKLGGAEIGKSCFIDRIFLMNLDRTGLQGLKIGNDCYLGPLVLLDLAGKISFSDQVTVTARSSILSHHSVGYKNHPLIKFYPKKVMHTRLESGVVLGVASLILPGVTVGRESLIAAGAVVRTDIPEHVMAAGMPAIVKKQLQ